MNQRDNQHEIDAAAESNRSRFEGSADSLPGRRSPDADPGTSPTGETLGEQPAQASVMATRAGVRTSERIDTGRFMILGGGLALAVVFFIFTALAGKTSKKPIAPLASSAKSPIMAAAKGSVTPLMESDRIPATTDNANGQLQPNDIRRTKNPVQGTNAQHAPNPVRGVANGGGAAPASLAAIPSFSDTQQHWQEPSPADAASSNIVLTRPGRETREENALKEASLVFVRAPLASASPSATQGTVADMSDQAILRITPGTRVQAKLQTQISSAVQAPVVAVVEYTYALGDKVLIPAGARVYGLLQQADRSGLIGVKFDEIELLDGKRVKIEAIGAGLDLGPIKGEVTGKNTGRNVFVRAATGMGSLLAELAGNNSSGAFSEDDMLRERLAANIGSAGDAQILSLNANSHVVVSVPADTKIYVVFTKHEQETSTVRKIDHE